MHFYTVYNYKRGLDSHMMKNMEWGAVAYLTNSKYGRCSNELCAEVEINNNSDYITGSSTLIDYNNPKSVAFSTTNNYYGVFDMVGGAWEAVMGVMRASTNGKPASGPNSTDNSGFNGPYSSSTDTELKIGKEWPDSRYYDVYDYANTITNFNRGFFGDATKECGPFYAVSYSGTSKRVSAWNADLAYFIDTGGPWFARGGNFSDREHAGTSAFTDYKGTVNEQVSFRVVLTP